MGYEIQPKCEITLDITGEQYTQAALVHARWVGRLRNTIGMLVIGALLMVGGGLVFAQYLESTGDLSLLGLSLLMAVTGVLIPALYLLCGAKAVKKQAMADYRTFAKLMLPMTMRLFEDRVDTASPHLTLHDQYALMVKCIETKAFFLLIKDRNRFLIIPKAAFPDNKRSWMEDFLRMTFTRQYRKMTNLIW